MDENVDARTNQHPNPHSGDNETHPNRDDTREAIREDIHRLEQDRSSEYMSEHSDESLYLVVEASTAQASVALITDLAVLASTVVVSRDPITGVRTEGIAPSIARVFSDAHRVPSQLTAVVCGSGPGGFTSLRGAAAIAKGLCAALRRPLYPVSAPELMVAGIIVGTGIQDGRYLTSIDAGRGESYITEVNVHNGVVADVGAVTIVPSDAVASEAHQADRTILSVTGNHPVIPSAAEAFTLLPRIRASGPVDLDSWEPQYGRLAEAQVKWEATHGRPLRV